MTTTPDLDPSLASTQLSDALSGQLGLAGTVVDADALERSVAQFRAQGVLLPTFAQLADPSTIPDCRARRAGRRRPRRRRPRQPVPGPLAQPRSTATTPTWVAVPEHVVLPPSLTGVDSPIIVVFGEPFPMITAHKVLAAYACLAPRVITGQFDPTRHRAIWPSTGNYARGGVAISRIMGCRGVAILPAGMSPGALRLARPLGAPTRPTSSARRAARAT